MHQHTKVIINQHDARIKTLIWQLFKKIANPSCAQFFQSQAAGWEMFTSYFIITAHFVFVYLLETNIYFRNWLYEGYVR